MSIRNTEARDRDFQRSINTRPVTNDEIAYRDGYVRGKSTEQLEQDRRRAAEARIYEENARRRAENGASTGLIVGLLLASVAVVVGGFIYAYNQPVTVPDAAAPAPEAATPEPAKNETTIIERTVERTQEVVPAPSSVQPPDINVELPSPPQPAANPAPAESVQPEASTNPVSEPAQSEVGSN